MQEPFLKHLDQIRTILISYMILIKGRIQKKNLIKKLKGLLMILKVFLEKRIIYINHYIFIANFLKFSYTKS